MKQKLSTIMWALKVSFIISPIRFIVNLAITLLSSLIPVYLAIFIGNTLNSINEVITTSHVSNKSIFMLLFSLGIILVLETFFLYGSGIVTSALNVKITTKINEKFIRIVRNISIKNFDDSKFCDTFYIAKEGFNNIPFVTEIGRAHV